MTFTLSRREETQEVQPPLNWEAHAQRFVDFRNRLRAQSDFLFTRYKTTVSPRRNTSTRFSYEYLVCVFTCYCSEMSLTNGVHRVPKSQIWGKRRNLQKYKYWISNIHCTCTVPGVSYDKVSAMWSPSWRRRSSRRRDTHGPGRAQARAASGAGSPAVERIWTRRNGEGGLEKSLWYSWAHDEIISVPMLLPRSSLTEWIS